MNRFTYDAKSRLVAVDGSPTATYTYDAYNLRVENDAGITIAIAIFSKQPGSEFVAVYGSRSLSSEYVYLAAALIASLRVGGHVQFHHNDHFSVRVTPMPAGIS